MKQLFLLLLFAAYHSVAQVGINTTTPSAASALHVASSANNVNFGGLMPPKVTLAQRNAIPVSAADDGLLVFLTNGSTRCLQVYNGVQGIWNDIYCINLAPVATSVQFSGTQTSGQTLTGSFVYTDNEGNPAGTHNYKWYRADSAAGLNSAEIFGATSNTYTLTDSDIGKYIAFEVMPIATAGSSPGLAVRSSYSGAIAAKPTIISFVQLSQSVNENATPNTITLRFTFPNVSTSNVNVTVASSAYGRLTQTGPRTIVIPAGQTSPYNVVVFNVNNNTADDNNATLTFTITNVNGGSGANSIGTSNTDTCTIVDDEISLTFSENFQAFTAAGFAPTPAAGQLDSDIWRIAGLSAMPWSSTRTTAEFAHGTSNGNLANTVPNTGVWSFTTAGANRILGLQPNGTFFLGGIYLRIQNTSGVTLTNWDIHYVVSLFNDTVSGALDFGVLYSTNDAAYTIIPGTNPNFGGATANAWTSYTYSPNIVASVPNNGYLYLYFNLQNPQAYQAGKEVGIDNISITGTNF